MYKSPFCPLCEVSGEKSNQSDQYLVDAPINNWNSKTLIKKQSHSPKIILSLPFFLDLFFIFDRFSYISWANTTNKLFTKIQEKVHDNLFAFSLSDQTQLNLFTFGQPLAGSQTEQQVQLLGENIDTQYYIFLTGIPKNFPNEKPYVVPAISQLNQKTNKLEIPLRDLPSLSSPVRFQQNEFYFVGGLALDENMEYLPSTTLL